MVWKVPVYRNNTTLNSVKSCLGPSGFTPHRQPVFTWPIAISELGDTAVASRKLLIYNFFPENELFSDLSGQQQIFIYQFNSNAYKHM
jgi:hypothetical protein